MELEVSRVAQHILELANNPQVLPPEAGQEEKAEVEPDGEQPLVGYEIALEPQSGTLSSSLDTVRGKTVWAVDGGALTVDLPIGKLIIGRAVLVKMDFRGYETVKRELIIPSLPFIVCGGPAGRDVPEAAAFYLTEAIRLIPAEIQQRGSPYIDFFSDGDAYLDKFRDAWSGVTENEMQVSRALDLARNAAETIAFQTALRLANTGDLILRDGRLHGSVAFWTTLWGREATPASTPQSNDRATRAFDCFVEDVQNAVRRGVRVVGIIKRPVADECCKWFRENGYQLARYGSDAILYMRMCERLPSPQQFGKRSTLWRYKSFQSRGNDDLSPRQKLELFRRNIAFYYIMPGLNVTPFRVDIPIYENMYLTWYKEVADQIYTLARGSGSPSRIPHPIKIADAYARVNRGEVIRFLHGLIAEFERTSNTDLAKEIKAWIHRGR